MEHRAFDQLRTIEIIPDYTEMATGSALITCGRTKVICTCSIVDTVPDFLRGKGQGWLTAEYAMLPGSTSSRKARDGIKRDGRSVEIQRLIGRSLRAACDLTRLGERTAFLDCDVLQADGGTRTASITGAFVALCLAVHRCLENGRLKDSPIIRQVAAVSAGVVQDACMLDLDYAADSHAMADVNIVMTWDASGMGYVEVQGTGEGRPYTRGELDQLLALSEDGIATLMDAQLRALGDRASVIGKKPRLILASNNFGKLKELRAMLGDQFDVCSMREAGYTCEPEETGSTFRENALIKARALMEESGCAALADDSGLVVDALGGRPGVYSARYAGVHGDDDANNALLLKELEPVSRPEDRTARFVSALALCRPGREPLIVEGDCPGRILFSLTGDQGFGYDPLFFSDELMESFGIASEDAKNAVSHRGKAIQKLLEALGTPSSR